MAELPDDQLDDLTEADLTPGPSGDDRAPADGEDGPLSPVETRDLRTGHGLAPDPTAQIPEDLLDEPTSRGPIQPEPTLPAPDLPPGSSSVSVDLADDDIELVESIPPAPAPPPRRSSPAPAAPAQRKRRRKNPVEEIDELLGRQLGSYRIVTLLGEGGMGRVYLAEHVELGRKVALKLLRAEYAVKKDAVRRFFQEARAVNKIGHDNIVDITDLMKLDSGETFIIMEFLKGEDLTEIQRSGEGPMPLHRAMRIAMQVCDALEAAHQMGVVHRDLKPDNIFIVNDGAKRDFVKLLDFGVAKLLGDEEENDGWKTAVGSVIGTPAYMSPEQASGIPVDHRSDIYSLGAIMYELFTGHPVFRAKSFGEFVVKHMNDDPVPPRDLADAPKIPAALEHVILRCLEKDPAKRYQSVSELRDDLARATATVETVVHQVSGIPEAEAPGGRRWLLFVPVGLGVALLAGLAFWLASGLSFDESPAQPSAAVTPPGVSAASESGSEGDETTKAASDQASAKLVELTLHTQPSGAEVFRASQPGVSLGRTPLTLKVERRGDEVEFVFELEGYAAATEKVKVTDNTMISVALVQRPKARPEPAPAPKPAAQPKPKPRPAATRPDRPKARPVRPRPATKPKKPAPKPATKPKVKPNETVDPFADM